MFSTCRTLLVGASFLFIVSSAQAAVVDLPSFGAWAQGQDEEPVNININDGGPGTSTASVSFDTFNVESTYDPGSTYLPILRAQANGFGAVFDDDRTSTEAVAYEIFTSGAAQIIDLEVTLDSTVTAIPQLSTGPRPSAGVILDVWVFLDPIFDDFYCDNGERMSFGTYICGEQVARANIGHTTQSDGNGTLTQDETLSFEVLGDQTFGIYAELKASAFQGEADAFNTVSMQYLLNPTSRIDLIAPPGELPSLLDPPSEIPLPATVWMFGAGLIGLFGFVRRKTTS